MRGGLEKERFFFWKKSFKVDAWLVNYKNIVFVTDLIGKNFSSMAGLMVI